MPGEATMAVSETTWWRVLEVHNFGGFFGGDTVTLTARRWDNQVEETITIDEKSLVNMRDRYNVAPAMIFDLLMTGTRVDRAELLGASDWQPLKLALEAGPPLGPIKGLSIRAYYCAHCELWVVGTPLGDGMNRSCRLCREGLVARAGG
jgi:hypothetical protein